MSEYGASMTWDDDYMAFVLRDPNTGRLLEKFRPPDVENRLALYDNAMKWIVSLPNTKDWSAILDAANSANVAGFRFPNDVRYQMIGTQIVVAAVLIGAGWPV